MLKVLVDKRKEFETKQEKLHKVIEEAGAELDMEKIKSLEGDSKAKTEAIKKMNKELEDLGIEIDALVEQENVIKADAAREKGLEAMGGVHLPQPEGDKGALVKTIGELFVESDAFKNYRRGTKEGPVAELKDVTLKVLLKTAFTTAAGWAPETTRTGLMVPFATTPIRIADIIPGGSTNQTAIVYMEETTFTNAAAGVKENEIKPEAALALTERSSPVYTIAVWIPVTDQQLEDVEGIQSYLTNRLTFMLRQVLDQYLLTGTGIAPQITGLLNVAGIQTFVLAGDRFDAVYEAIKRIRVTGRADPNVVVMHPNDWQVLRLMRSTDGLYILGNPTEPGPVRIWGMPVVEATAETENTVLVGDFANFCQLFEKKGVDIQISDSHDTYFIYNKKAVRADIRVAFPCYRPAAFCTVTGF